MPPCRPCRPCHPCHPCPFQPWTSPWHLYLCFSHHLSHRSLETCPCRPCWPCRLCPFLQSDDARESYQTSAHSTTRVTYWSFSPTVLYGFMYTVGWLSHCWWRSGRMQMHVYVTARPTQGLLVQGLCVCVHVCMPTSRLTTPVTNRWFCYCWCHMLLHLMRWGWEGRLGQ